MYFNSHYLVAFYLFIKNNQKNPIYYSRVCPSERFFAPTGPPPSPINFYMTKLVFIQYYLGLG